jgi:O-antigen ligase
MNPRFPKTLIAPRGHCVAATGALRARRLDSFARAAFLFLWLFVFSVPWENSILVPVFGTPTRLIGVVAFGFGVLGIVERGYMKWPSEGFLLLTAFVAWSAATYFWSVNPEATAVRIRTYCQLLGVAFLISQFCSGRQRLTRLIQAYLLGTCVSSLDTIVNYYLKRDEGGYQRYAATGFDANGLGVILALSLPFSYQMAVASRGVRGWLYRLHLVVAVTAILLTGSRTALVTSLVALGIVPVTALLRGSRAVAATLVAAGIVFGAVRFIVPETSWQRLNTLTADGTIGSRRAIWAAGLEVFPSRPLLGVGSGAYEDSVTPILGRVEGGHFIAHNTYLSILVECGLVGLCIVILLVRVIAHHVAALPSARRMGWTFCLLALATGMTGLTWEERKPTWVLLNLCLVESACSVSRSPRRRLLAERCGYPQESVVNAR